MDSKRKMPRESVQLNAKSRLSQEWQDKIRAKKKSKGGSSKTTYFPGAFGTSAEPEINIDGEKQPKKAKVKQKNIKRKAVKPKEQPVLINSAQKPKSRKRTPNRMMMTYL
eukprot:TCONS_00050140-protein